MINGVRCAQAGQFEDSAVMSRKAMTSVMNMINIIESKWAPRGLGDPPGRVVFWMTRHVMINMINIINVINMINMIHDSKYNKCYKYDNCDE